MTLYSLDQPPSNAPEGVAGVLRSLDGKETLAWWLNTMLVSPGGSGLSLIERLLNAQEAPATLLAWSGGLGEGDFARSPLTWMGPGQSSLAAACDHLNPTLERTGRRLLLRTHCRHVLSDGPAAAAFAEGRNPEQFGVAFDPASMLEASMLSGAEEHLDRLAAYAHRCAALVVLGNVSPPSDPGDEALPVVVDADAGVLPVRGLRAIGRAGAEAGAGVVLLAADPVHVAIDLGLVSPAGEPT